MRSVSRGASLGPIIPRRVSFGPDPYRAAAKRARSKIPRRARTDAKDVRREEALAADERRGLGHRVEVRHDFGVEIRRADGARRDVRPEQLLAGLREEAEVARQRGHPARFALCVCRRPLRLASAGLYTSRLVPIGSSLPRSLQFSPPGAQHRCDANGRALLAKTLRRRTAPRASNAVPLETLEIESTARVARPGQGFVDFEVHALRIARMWCRLTPRGLQDANGRCSDVI